MNEPDIQKLEVLVIDDEPFIRKLISRMLYEMNVKLIAEAEDGAEGLSKIRQSRTGYDVIICDLEMPKMNGFEFVRQLRKDQTVPNPAVPVLILTGHSDEDNLQESVKLGIHGFLTKPVSKANLEKRLLGAMKSPPIDPKILERL